MRFLNLHLSAEQRRVGACQFVSEFDVEVDESGIGGPLLFGNVSTAARNLPPVTGACLFGLTVKLDPRTRRQIEFDVELPTTRNGTIHSIFDGRHPTPKVITLLVDIQSKGRN